MKIQVSIVAAFALGLGACASDGYSSAEKSAEPAPIAESEDTMEEGMAEMSEESAMEDVTEETASAEDVVEGEAIAEGDANMDKGELVDAIEETAEDVEDVAEEVLE